MLPELVKMYNYRFIAELYILGGCFECESRKSSGVQITLTLLVTPYKLVQFEDAKLVTRNITYHSVSCFEDFRGTAVRQVTSTDLLN